MHMIFVEAGPTVVDPPAVGRCPDHPVPDEPRNGVLLIPVYDPLRYGLTDAFDDRVSSTAHAPVVDADIVEVVTDRMVTVSVPACGEQG